MSVLSNHTQNHCRNLRELGTISASHKFGPLVPSACDVVRRYCPGKGYFGEPARLAHLERRPILIAAINVVSCSRAARDLLKSFRCGMGHSIGCPSGSISSNTLVLTAPASA